MSARSLSAKMASFAAKSAAKSSVSSVSGVESSMLDMVLMGAGVVVIILLLVYIYNRFIHKQPAKNEYFGGPPRVDSRGNTICPPCNCGNTADKSGKLTCVRCKDNEIRDNTGMCVINTNDEY